MPHQPKCPECGSALGEASPAGLCPRCLMALNLKPDTVLTGEAQQGHRTVPVEQIAPHFPQLEILECLGRGGMGVVYKARQRALNRLVALKLLAPERVCDPQFADRFAREALALAALNHPAIVTIHDFGTAGGFYFLLMEYVDGVNLRHVLRDRSFKPEEALAIVPAICDALQFAHDRGVVHRDIKPENVLLDKTGRVKIADFGIAKMLGDSPAPGGMARRDSESVSTHGIVGTPGYSAPEQMRGSLLVDNRVDIYSLGVMLYEMLTGELPGKPMVPPSRKVQVDVRLDSVVLRALEKVPELRYQQVSEVKTMLETIVTSADETDGVKLQRERANPGGAGVKGGTPPQSFAVPDPGVAPVPRAGIFQLHWVTILLLTLALYWMGGSLGRAAAFDDGSIALVWPTAGIGLALICLFGPRFWPAVALGSLLFAFMQDRPWIFFMLGTVVGNTVGALACRFLLVRYFQFRRSMERVRDVAGFLATACLLGTTLNAALSALSLYYTSDKEWNQLFQVTLEWWMPTAMGTLVVTPLILCFSVPARIEWDGRVRIEALVWLAALVGGTHLSFNSWPAYGIQNYPFAYLPYPFLVWGSLRFGQRGATVGTLIVAAFSISSLLQGRGPFVTGGVERDSLMMIGTYISILAVTNLMLGAIANEVRAALSVAMKHRSA